MEEFDRITRNPPVMGGKACIRSMRVTVGMIVGQIAEGATPEELLTEFPYIEREDITRLYGMQRGSPANGKSISHPHEDLAGHESIASLHRDIIGRADLASQAKLQQSIRSAQLGVGFST